MALLEPEGAVAGPRRVEVCASLQHTAVCLSVCLSLHGVHWPVRNWVHAMAKTLWLSRTGGTVVGPRGVEVCVTDERHDTEPARARRLSTGDCRIGTAVTQASGCGGCNADDDAGCEHEATERLSRAGTPWRLLGFRWWQLEAETLVGPSPFPPGNGKTS